MNKEQVRAIALAHGFELKEQADRTLDLNPYVYKFAQALLANLEEQLAGKTRVIATMRRVENLLRDDLEKLFEENTALKTHAAPPSELVGTAKRAAGALAAFCDGPDWIGTVPGDALRDLRAELKKVKP